MSRRRFGLSTVVLAAAFGAAAHEEPVGTAPEHRTRFICDYEVSGEQNLANGQQVSGSRQKRSIAYVVDWEDETVSRVDLAYPAEITPQLIRFSIGNVDYRIDRTTGDIRGRSQTRTAAGEAIIRIDGSCTAEPPVMAGIEAPR